MLETLDNAKAEVIVSIDLKGETSMGDQMVVAWGRSQRHIRRNADNLVRKLKEAGFGKARVEGTPQCDWVLIDTGDVMVLIFHPRGPRIL